MDLHTLVRNALKIAVFGSDEDHCTDAARGIAYFVGREIAQRNYILYTGGLGGVMEAASRGAAEAGGISVGIIPFDDPKRANPYCALVIPTGIGFARMQVLAHSVDAAVLVEGSWGTRTEAQWVNYLERPVVALPCSGGTAADVAGKVIDEARKKSQILSAVDHRSALDLIEAYYLRR